MKQKKIDNMTDDEVLKTIHSLLQRADIGNELVQNEDGVFTHQVTVVQAGERYFSSEPEPLAWPLIPLPLPEGMVN